MSTLPTDHIVVPSRDNAPIHSSSVARWMWFFTAPYKWTVLGFAVYRLFRYTIFGLIPIVIGYVIDGFDSGALQADPGHYAWVLFGFLSIYFAVLMPNFVFTPEVRAYEKAARAMTLYSITHLNSLPLEWHERNESGKKLQRVMTGRRGYQEMARHLRWDVFALVGQTVAIAISFFIVDMPAYYLALYAAFALTYGMASWHFAKPYFNLYDKFNQTFENLLGGVYEFVSSIRTVKSFHLEKYVESRGGVLEGQGQYAIIRAYHQNLIRWSIVNGIAGIWLFIFAALGFKLTLDGDMTAGVFAGTFFLAFRLWSELEVIAAIQEKIYEYGNGIARLIETLRVTPRPLDIEPKQALPPAWQGIDVSALAFSYGKDSDGGAGVYDVNFTVKRGEKIAFVGESGAGKSTLIKLMMKQMLPASGAIAIDGINLNHIPSAQWLAQIGFVPQEVELFNMSIRDNILIDQPGVSDAVYTAALEQAALSDFIARLPEGDATLIGERGIKLSGGQRQRLGIARALVRQAEIIIFDEATSALDSISEKKIHYAMENAFQGHTVFLIAHRLSTVRHVDRILVLDQGRVIEEGTFADLIARPNGVFARLWDIQTQALDLENS